MEPHEPSPSFESDAAVRAVRARVREALAVLSPVQREVVIHHYVKGYSYQQTAALLGVEVRTVRSRLQKARRRLHGEMTDMTATPTDTTTYELTASDFEALSHAWWAAFSRSGGQKSGLML